ncbi:MAG: Fic family protein [Lachnospiraceae bacterium]|nr:Fic family protein [Lachnospiraceae bacterium]
MRDPYLYDNSSVLINKLGIKNQEVLEGAEADYVSLRLKDVALHPLMGDYHTPHFLKMHEVIFQDLYEWAGSTRTISIYKEEDVLGGMSIEYADPFDIVDDLSHALESMRTKNWDRMEPIVRAHEFSDSLAQIWKVHPFREGNTRTAVTFCCQYIDEIGYQINRDLFEKNARYLRTALVAYNAYFSDGSNFAKKEYLYNIVEDALGLTVRK